MPAELTRIAHDLEQVGYAVTSYEALGVDFDAVAARSLDQAVVSAQESAEALEVVKHITKQAMTIVQDPRCMELGRGLIQPAIGALLVDRPEQEQETLWTLFGLNRYEQGGQFGPHRDDVSASVLVVTVSGSRNFDLYKTTATSRQDELTDVEASFSLGPGSILILDGEKDPGHAISDTPEASVVAVADIPFILRNLDGRPTSVPFSPPPRNY